MRFYNNSHPYYCGIDLHARLLYVCIIDSKGEVVVHKKIGADKDDLLLILEPYIGNVIVGVECMHCWYWVSDWCTELGIDFVLGHALYMKAIHGGKTKNDKVDSFKIATLLRGGNFPIAYDYPSEMRAARDLLRRRMKIVRHGAMLKGHVVNTNSQYNLPATDLNLKNISARQKLREQYQDPIVQRNIDLDMALLDCYAKELAQHHRRRQFQMVKVRPSNTLSKKDFANHYPDKAKRCQTCIPRPTLFGAKSSQLFIPPSDIRQIEETLRYRVSIRR